MLLLEARAAFDRRNSHDILHTSTTLFCLERLHERLSRQYQHSASITSEVFFFPFFSYLSPRCSGVSPPLPQLGQLLSPNPWQSKHFHLSKMFPFFLFLPVPLQPGHSIAPFPLHVLQPEEDWEEEVVTLAAMVGPGLLQLRSAEAPLKVHLNPQAAAISITLLCSQT